jgi:hypothetical protein
VRWAARFPLLLTRTLHSESDARVFALRLHTQVLSTAVKIDPSLPHPGVPSPPPAAEPSGTSANGNGHGPKKAPPADSSDMSEEEVPLSQKASARPPTTASTSTATSPKAGPSRSVAGAEEDDDSKPLAKLPPIKRNKKPTSAVKKEPAASESESDAPLKSRRAAPAKGKKRKSMKEERCVSSTLGSRAIPAPQ